MMIGYFFGKNFPSISSLVLKYIFLIILGVVYLGILIYYIKKYIFTKKYTQFFKIEKRRILKYCTKHILFIIFLILSFYSFILYLIFFKFVDYSGNLIKTLDFNYNISHISEMKNFDFETYFSDNPNSSIQPINTIVITDKDLSDILQKMWWVQNQIFVSNAINFRDYIHLYKTKELPVSNMFFSGFVQNSAFQIPSQSNLKRIHLRIWNFWVYNAKKIYFISISKDKKIDFEFYNYFITPIHEIEPDVDKQRNLLLNEFQRHYPIKYTSEKWNMIKNVNYKYNYITDGGINIIEL